MGVGDNRKSWCGRYLYILYLQSDTKVDADEKKIVKNVDICSLTVLMLISGIWYKWIGIGSSRIMKFMMINGIVLKRDRLW